MGRTGRTIFIHQTKKLRFKETECFNYEAELGLSGSLEFTFHYCSLLC